MTETSEIADRLDATIKRCRKNHVRPSAAHLEQARNGLREADQAIGRLEREGNEREKQYADLLASHEEDLEALEKAEQQLAEARAEIEHYKALYKVVDAAYTVVIGWRERDWPEGFDRRTAELIADAAREALPAPAPIETTGKAAVMDPTIAKKQQESG